MEIYNQYRRRRREYPFRVLPFDVIERTENKLEIRCPLCYHVFCTLSKNRIRKKMEMIRHTCYPSSKEHLKINNIFFFVFDGDVWKILPKRKGRNFTHGKEHKIIIVHDVILSMYNFYCTFDDYLVLCSSCYLEKCPYDTHVPCDRCDEVLDPRYLSIMNAIDPEMKQSRLCCGCYFHSGDEVRLH